MFRLQNLSRLSERDQYLWTGPNELNGTSFKYICPYTSARPHHLWVITLHPVLGMVERKIEIYI